jgi:hypothetical protein
MALKDITITGSIGSYPTLSYGQKTYISSTDEESFPIEHFTGSSGGSTPNFNGQYSTTNLFVNITQSWTGSINTQVGIVDFTHDTQEEFINGEYSGSGIEVTHQRLIDNQCIQLLNVSTVPVNYKSFFYVAINTNPFNPPDPDYGTIINNFLNSNTSPNSGEIYLLSTQNAIQKPGGGFSNIRKVTHIKINRFDDQGNDNTLSLQEQNLLRILFSDLGAVDFPILSITEYPTYYLYTVDKTLPNGNINSVDNNVLDYSFSASISTFNLPFYNDWSGSGLVPSVDARSYFNPVEGNYLFGDTPNVLIQFTASLNLGTSMQGVFYFNRKVPNSTTAVAFTSSAGAGTYILSGSFYPIKNETYELRVVNTEISPGTYTINNIQWQFTQSIAPSSSTNLTVLEPYLLENFEYSDCNALFNNATILEYDPNFYKVNYDTGLLIPTNQQEILNGTAEFAPVKPYNYSLNAQVLPRYNGVKVVQQRKNVWTSGDISPSKTPSVQSLSTYFAYFEWMGGTTPELKDKFAASLKYLINEDGDVLTPNLTSSYYYNLIDNFETGQRVNISLYSDVGSVTNVGGPKSILRAGAIPWGIVASQTGSGNNIQTPILFGNLNSLIPNYFSIYTGSAPSQQIPPGTTSIINPEYAITQNFTTTYSIGPDYGIEITNDTNLTQIAVQINIIFTLIYQPYASSYPVTLRIYRSTDGGITYDETNYEVFPVIFGETNYISLTSPYFPAQSGDKYKFELFNQSGYILEINNGLNGNISTFNVLQNPPAIVASASYSAGSLNYWETGSSSRNILTGSQFFNIYNPGNPLVQKNYSASGYFDFLPFSLQIGDIIRFEGDEIQTFEIYGINNNPIDQTLYLTLNRNIPNGTDLNSFLIRRYHPHPNFVTLDWDGSGFTGGPGFLFPEYGNNNIVKNFNNIIVKLKEKNLI